MKSPDIAAGVGANTRNPNHGAGSWVSGGGRELRIRQEERTQRSEASSALCCAVAETPGLAGIRQRKWSKRGREREAWGSSVAADLAAAGAVDGC